MGIVTIKPNKHKTGFVYDRREQFLIDAEEDLVLLTKNAVAGSTAWLADCSKKYVLNSALEWVEENVGSGGASGGFAGGGEKRTIIVDMPSPGYLTFTIDISFDDLRAAIKAGNVPDIECLVASNSSDDYMRVERVIGVSIEDKDNIIIDIKSYSMKYSSDGTLQPVVE